MDEQQSIKKLKFISDKHCTIQYLETFSVLENGKVRCKKCNIEIVFKKKNDLDKHIISKNHQAQIQNNDLQVREENMQIEELQSDQLELKENYLKVVEFKKLLQQKIEIERRELEFLSEVTYIEYCRYNVEFFKFNNYEYQFEHDDLHNRIKNFLKANYLQKYKLVCLSAIKWFYIHVNYKSIVKRGLKDSSYKRPHRYHSLENIQKFIRKFEKCSLPSISFQLLYMMALRVQDLAAIDLKKIEQFEIEDDEGEVQVHYQLKWKCRKQRNLEREGIITQELHDEIVTYLSQNSISLSQENGIFLFRKLKIAKNQIQKWLKGSGFQSHDFRKSRVQNLYNRGILTIEQVKVYLGHRDIRSTMKYVEVNQNFVNGILAKKGMFKM